MTFDEAADRVVSTVLTGAIFARRAFQRNPNAPLLPDHQINGIKVAAYETHWIVGCEFTFAFVAWPVEGFRIYILKSPSYGLRSGCSRRAHWLPDVANGKKYVCVDARAYPDTLTAARELALMWAQATARYIRTGVIFQ